MRGFSRVLRTSLSVNTARFSRLAFLSVEQKTILRTFLVYYPAVPVDVFTLLLLGAQQADDTIQEAAD